MKRILAFALTLVLALSLAACGPKDLTPEKALLKLEKAMVFVGETDEGLVTVDGEQLVWDADSLYELDINGGHCYAWSLYLAEPRDPEQPGQHYADYAIALNGLRCYRFNPAPEVPGEEWEEL